MRQSILLPSELAVGDNDDVDTTIQGNDGRSRKSSKGRKSLLLPSELNVGMKGVPQDDEEKKEDSPRKTIAITSEAVVNVAQPVDDTPCTGEANMEEIKAAIRKYCSMPLEERYKSDDALRVEELTGYPLNSAMDKVNRERMENGSISTPIKLSWASSESSQLSEDELAQLSNELKRSLFEKMRPLVQVMETKKREDTAMLEEATKCRVERKKGKFRYVSLITGKKISSREYERRYLIKIQKQRDEKLLEMEVEEAELNANSSASLQNALPDKMDVDVAEKSKSALPQVEKPESTETKMDDDLLPNCDDTVDVPSRDEICSDPEIAAAQGKLFDKFDKAMDEYMDTVLRIRAERKLQKKSDGCKSET